MVRGGASIFLRNPAGSPSEAVSGSSVLTPIGTEPPRARARAPLPGSRARRGAAGGDPPEFRAPATAAHRRVGPAACPRALRGSLDAALRCLQSGLEATFDARESSVELRETFFSHRVSTHESCQVLFQRGRLYAQTERLLTKRAPGRSVLGEILGTECRNFLAHVSERLQKEASEIGIIFGHRSRR